MLSVWVFRQLLLSVLAVLMKRFHICCDERADAFWRGTRVSEPRSRREKFNTANKLQTMTRWKGEKKEAGRAQTKCITRFLFLLCAQSESWKCDVKRGRPQDWDVDKILTQTGYLKPLTFFPLSACWKICLHDMQLAATGEKMFWVNTLKH